MLITCRHLIVNRKQKGKYFFLFRDAHIEISFFFCSLIFAGRHSVPHKIFSNAQAEDAVRLASFPNSSISEKLQSLWYYLPELCLKLHSSPWPHVTRLPFRSASSSTITITYI